jgi:hypothetical protein
MTMKWFSEFRKIGILDSEMSGGKRKYYLKTPFTIHITENVIRKIREKYNPKVEKGGLLLGKPLKNNSERMLEIREVEFVKNISNNPNNSYQYESNQYNKIINYCLSGEKNGRFYFPINFHTHPTYHKEDFNSLLNYLNQVGTSLADKRFCKEEININSHSLILPNALVVGTDKYGDKLFIGFYGGNIAPSDFIDYMGKVAGETFGELIDIIKKWMDKPWKWIIIISIIGFILIKYPKVIFPMFFIILISMKALPLSISSIEKKPKYFTEVKEREVLIKIPEFNK